VSEFGDMTIQVRRVADDPEKDQAAVRAVMLRVADGRLDHAGAYRVLEALGLIEASSGGKYTPWGARNTKNRLRRRRSAAEGSPRPSGNPDDWQATTGQSEARMGHQEPSGGGA
jgi:hypothetical protein